MKFSKRTPLTIIVRPRALLIFSILCCLFFALTSAQEEQISIPDSLNFHSETNEANNSIPNPYYSGFFFDSNQSMRSGAENIFSLHQSIYKIGDVLLGNKGKVSKNQTQNFGKRAIRFSRFIFVDMPISFSLIVRNHEYYGHASRYREFDLGKVKYHYNAPPPYGEGGGYANVSGYSKPLSDQDKIVIWQGGWEAHDMLTRRISLEWVMNGQSNYHESALYLWTWQDRFQYVQWENDQLPQDITGSMFDPEGYVWFLNRHAGYDDPDNLKFNLKDLRTSGLVGLADPFVWYSLYSQFVGYIYNGKKVMKLPFINLGKIQYIPSMRTSFTPFGPQYHIENYIKWKSGISLIDLQVGDDVFYSNWWGVGITLQGLVLRESIPLNIYVNFWDQPAFHTGDAIGPALSEGFGAAVSLRGHYSIKNNPYSILLMAELGYKSAGFIQGYPLDSSAIIMLGVGIESSN